MMEPVGGRRKLTIGDDGASEIAVQRAQEPGPRIRALDLAPLAGDVSSSKLQCLHRHGRVRGGPFAAGRRYC